MILLREKLAQEKMTNALQLFARKLKLSFKQGNLVKKKKKMNGAKERQRPHAQSLTLDGS